MKAGMKFYIALTTLLLMAVAIMVVFNLPFPLVFITMVTGQIFLAIMVYKILTDDYSTPRTFEDWYEERQY